MSARVESPPIRGGTLGGSFVIAVVAALLIGAFVGSLVTYAIESDGGASVSSTFVARGTPAVADAGVGHGSKGIEGPMLAARFSGLAYPNVWDADKLEAMQAGNWPRSLVKGRTEAHLVESDRSTGTSTTREGRAPDSSPAFPLP